MRNTAFAVHPVTSAVGAELLDIDLAAEQGGQTWLDIRHAIDSHGVVFFRDQTLTTEQQLAFAKRFGTPLVPRSNLVKPMPGLEGITEVRNDLDRKMVIGNGWHTDQPMRKNPPWATMLFARELPSKGGDTLFISMAAVFDSLSDGLKQTLEGLRVIQRQPPFLVVRGPDGKPGTAEQAIHPAVIRHPGSGRKVLYVNPDYTVGFEGWTEAESRPLLEHLWQHARRPEFGCRFHWAPGSIAIWDNYQTWHYAVDDYPGERRVMNRVMLESVPFGGLRDEYD